MRFAPKLLSFQLSDEPAFLNPDHVSAITVEESVEDDVPYFDIMIYLDSGIQITGYMSPHELREFMQTCRNW